MGSAEAGMWRGGATLAALVALFMAGVSNCADTNCTSPDGPGGTFIIDSQAAADTLSSCPTVTGNVAIQSNTLTQLTLNGIQIIQGNLAASVCDGLQKIVAPALSQIGQNLTLSGLPLLTSLEFPLLDYVNGGIYWDTLPELSDISFGNLTANSHDLPGANIDGDISIIGTGISSLGFLNFTHFSNPDRIWIKSNHQLNNINLTGLSWGSNSLAIVDNGPLAQIYLPSLKTAGAISISNVGHIDIPSLLEAGGTLEISNNSIDVFTAPNITSIGGDFLVNNNAQLEDLSLSRLTSVDGNFVVANNTMLSTITNLNQLWYSHGNLTFSGNISNVTLPNLRSIIGGFHITSSNPALDCTAFDKLADQESWTSSFYSCVAYLPGKTRDLAKHYKAPHNGLYLSKPVTSIIVIVSVVAGLLLGGIVLRRVQNRRKRRATPPEAPVLELDQIAVTTRDEEGGLPKYSRVGKPGEVPPGYVESQSTTAPAAEPASANANTGSLTTISTRARRLWRLW